MTGSSTTQITRILLITLLTFAIAAIHVAAAPTLAAAQEGTTIKDEGRIAYAQYTVEETEIIEEREVQSPRQTQPEIQPETQRETHRVQREVYQEPEPTQWLWVVGRNAVMGGIVGGILGSGAYLLSAFEWSPWIITQFAGGGILVGASVGLIDVMFRDDVFAQRPASLDWIERDAPKTLHFRLFETSF